MTLQEKELLTRFVQQLVAAQPGQKDPEADALIREAVARQPDAAYLLVQRAMQLEQLLQASQTEVQKLQAQVAAGSGSSGGFLSDPNAWGKEGAPRLQPAAAQVPAAAAPAAAPAAAGSWGSGLFGNIAATAAGVVAGSFLFQGIQGLMHHGDTKPPEHNPQVDQALADEPELLNSYETAAGGELSDSFADSGGSGGDFG